MKVGLCVSCKRFPWHAKWVSLGCLFNFLTLFGLFSKRALGQLEEELAIREGPMMQWQTNLKMMASKERQYLQQLANYKVHLPNTL